jgi:hypothetical protein
MTKKRVKIGTSSIFKSESELNNQNSNYLKSTNSSRSSVKSKKPINKSNKAIPVQKSKSLSPVKNKSTHWCPPPGRSTKSATNNNSSNNLGRRTPRLCEFDHIPVRESSTKKNGPKRQQNKLESRSSCEVCSTRSPSVEERAFLKSRPVSRSSCSSCSSNRRSVSPPIKLSRESSCSNNSKRRRFSLSPCALSRLGDPNSTYTKFSRAQSHDSPLVRCSSGLNNNSDGFIEDVVYPCRDFLVERLVETEAHAYEIAKHLGQVRDFMACELSAHVAPTSIPFIMQRLEYDRIELLKRLELYELNNRELRGAIYDLVDARSLMNSRTADENNALRRHVEALEAENNVKTTVYLLKIDLMTFFDNLKDYKRALDEFECNMKQTGSAYQILNVNYSIKSLKIL